MVHTLSRMGKHERDGRIDVGMEASMHRAAMRSGFQGLHIVIRKSAVKGNRDGESRNSSRWLRRHVLFNVNANAAEVDAPSLGHHRHDGHDARP